MGRKKREDGGSGTSATFADAQFAATNLGGQQQQVKAAMQDKARHTPAGLENGKGMGASAQHANAKGNSSVQQIRSGDAGEKMGSRRSSTGASPAQNDVAAKVNGTTVNGKGPRVDNAADMTEDELPDRSNMSSSQKKNLKRKLKKKQEREEGIDGAAAAKDIRETARKNVEKELVRRLAALPDLSLSRVTVTPQQVDMQQVEIETIIKDIVDAIQYENSQTVKPVIRKQTVAQLKEQIKDLKAKTAKARGNNDPVSEGVLNDSMTYVEYLQEQLNLALSVESFREFQTRLTELRHRCEEKARQNVRYMERAIEEQKKVNVAKKLEDLKKHTGGSSGTGSCNDITSASVELPPQSMTIIMQIIRKLERAFQVIIDRPGGPKGGKFQLMGSPEDVAKCVDFMKGCDYAKNYLQLDSRSLRMNAKLGKDIEADREVFIYVQGDNMAFVGPSEKVAHAMQLVRTSVEELEEVVDAQMPYAMRKYLANDRIAQIKDIEANTNVKFWFNTGSQSEGVAIRGKHNNIEEGRAALTKLSDSLTIVDIAKETDDVRKAANEAKVVVQNLGCMVAVVTNAGKVQLVGEAADVEKVRAKTAETLASMPTIIPVSRNTLYFWSPKNLKAVESVGEVTVRLIRGERQHLEISGPEAHRLKAEAVAREIISRPRIEEEVKMTDDVVSVADCRRIELETGATLVIDRATMMIKVRGEADDVAAARLVVEGIIETTVSASVAIEKRQAGLIIGKQGVTIKGIKESTGVSRIDIVDDTSVVIKGSPEAVQKAKDMVLETLREAEASRLVSAARNGVEGEGNVSSNRPPRERPSGAGYGDNQSGGRRGGGGNGGGNDGCYLRGANKKTQKWVTNKSEEAQQAPTMNMLQDDKQAFPALGGATGAMQWKAKGAPVGDIIPAVACTSGLADSAVKEVSTTSPESPVESPDTPDFSVGETCSISDAKDD